MDIYDREEENERSFIELRNVSFRYEEDIVLKNVDIDIEKGSFNVLCGFSGSGKTTLLRLLKPSLLNNGAIAGEVMIDRKTEPDRRFDAEKIAFIGQDPDSEITGAKVWQHMAFALESLGYDNGSIRKRAAETAAYFGISNIFEADTGTLSGGQKQLVNLASAIMTDPLLVILDEPTATLDPVGADRLFDMLEKINRDLGITVVISEHRLERCLSAADRLIIMDSGRKAFDGKKEELYGFLKENMYYTELFNDMVKLGVRAGESIPFTAREGRAFAEKLGIKGKCEAEAAMEKECAIGFDELWFRYEDDDILKGATGRVYKGEVYALLGANGAGKSTLMSLLAGVKKPYRGRVDVAKEAVTAFMPQDPKALFYRNTLLEDMLTVTKDEELIKEMSSFCGIEGLLKRHPYDISGGELQRAALCKVMLKKPDIIFMDEPTKGMDGEFKKKFAALLDSLKKEGKTVFMVSHDTEFCAKAADRCGLFFGGRVTAEDEKRRFLDNNRFYTTAVSRAFKDMVKGAVTEEDILGLLGIKKDTFEKKDDDGDIYGKEELREIKNGTQTGKIVMLAVITAIAVAARLAFFMLPQFKPVAAVIISAASVFGPLFGLLSGAMSMLVSNMFFGQGPWTFFQMAGMGLVGLLAGAVFKRTNKNSKAMAVYSFIAVVVIYGVIVNTSNVLMYQDGISAKMIAAACAAALPLDILHGAFTAGLIIFFGKEFTDKLKRVRKKYRIGL